MTRAHPIAAVIAVSALAVLALAAGSLASHSLSATYSGPAATGGTISFNTSADGSSVTSFSASNVPTTCGMVSVTSTGNYPIANESFGNTSGQLRFSGTFPADQQASGTLKLVLSGYPSCTSDDVSWTATTPTPPPTNTTPTTTTPTNTTPTSTTPTTTTPETTPAPAADTTPPGFALSAARVQRVRGGTLTVSVACPVEACNVRVGGTVSVPGRAKVYRLGSASATLAAGGTKKLTLRPPRAALTAITKAVARRSAVRATVTGVAKDAAGNATTRRVVVRVRS